MQQLDPINLIYFFRLMAFAATREIATSITASSNLF